jgi:hypothetical protein
MASIDRDDYETMVTADSPRFDAQDGGFPWLRLTFLAMLGATTLLPFALLLAQ